MAASSIFFNGRLISKPGSYSVIDASGLEQVGLGASGIVAIVGEGEGGRPASTMTKSSEFLRLTRPEAARSTFRSGDMREACSMVFEPSSDAQILGGAQTVIAMKVNPATQSTATFSNASGTALLVRSVDYGAFTSQANLSIANGTVKGKLLTVALESTTEATDNVGGDTMFTLQYISPAGAGGWEAMNAQVLSSGVCAYGSRTDIGGAAEVSTTAMAPDSTIEVVATAGDAGKTIVVYGRNGTTLVTETLTLINGTVAGTVTFTAVYGSRLSAAAAGAITVRRPTGPTTLHSYSAAQSARGVQVVSDMYMANTNLVMAADAAATTDVHIYGRSTTGAVQSERFVLAGTALVIGTATWSKIEYIVLGDTAAARTVTFTAPAVQTSNLVQNTLKKVADYFNARSTGGVSGFFFTLGTGQTTRLVSSLDKTSGAGPNVYSPATGTFTADLDAIVSAFANGSQIVSGEAIAFAPQINDVTITPAVATFTVTINGTAIAYTSGLGTAADIQAGLIAQINATPAVRYLVTASAGSATTIVRLTSRTSQSFTLAVGAGLAAASVQTLAGVGFAPSNTSQPNFLTGGSEGTTTNSDWQAALNLLKQIRVNSIVVLTGNPAVHAALEAHCAFMCGVGRNERDGFVGLSALDSNDSPTNALPTKTSIKSQIVNLNSRHLRAYAQNISRYNTAGELTTFTPWFEAVLAAGMQAGAPVGTSLTFKYVNCLDVAQHSTWNPIDDGEEMIQSGLSFLETVDGVGRRFVRNVTTYLQTSNLAYTEGSVNAAVNFAAYTLRTNMEAAVGKPGFAGTINAAKGIAVNTLGLLKDAGVIVAWRALTLTLVADVLELSVELSPTIPINFVKNVIHLNALRQVA